MDMAASEGILHELQREVDAFLQVHGAALAEELAKPEPLDGVVVTAPAMRVKPQPPAHSQSTSATEANMEDAFCWRAALARVEWMSATAATRCLTETVQLLLSWLTAVEGAHAGTEKVKEEADGGNGGAAGGAKTNAVEAAGVAMASPLPSISTQSKAAAWLVGHALITILRHGATSLANSRSTANAIETMVEKVLDRCIVVFQEGFQLDCMRAVETSSGFFAFKSVQYVRAPPTAASVTQDHIVSLWRTVFALAAPGSLQAVSLRLQKQLLRGLLSGKSQHPHEYSLLANLVNLRLGLDTTNGPTARLLAVTPFPQRVTDAAACLKLLLHLIGKPHKMATRLEAIATVVSMISHELEALDDSSLALVYVSAHSSEWNACISEMHSIALKLSSKKDYVAVGWQLRIAVLSIAPCEIFGRYWKEDVQLLLRVQYQQNKDGGGGPHATTIMGCVGDCITHVIRRHLVMNKSLPSESDCMEIINTAQAWCFFSFPKHKSLQRLTDQVLPVLLDISVAIAAYNMQYGIQSHVRRLLMEAENVFDEKKLVGVEAMVAILDLGLGSGLNSNNGTQVKSLVGSNMNREVLETYRVALGEMVGHILIECNTNFGQELLVECTSVAGSAPTPSITSAKLMKDEYRRAIAIRTYAVALSTLQFLFTTLELTDDQKMLIIARACIHGEDTVRTSAAKMLHQVLENSNCQAPLVFRGLTDYVMRISCRLEVPEDFLAPRVLTELVGSLMQVVLRNDQEAGPGTTTWNSLKERDESLLQVEAMGVYLLVYEDCRVRLATLDMLCAVVAVRNTGDNVNHAVAVEGSENLPNRLSVVDIFRDADTDLQQHLQSYDGDVLVKRDPGDELWFLRSLLVDESERAGFKRSMGLALLFSRLVVWIPDVTSYIWSDVNDKIVQFEPIMMTSTPDTEEFGSYEIARWRNLTILATSTACANLALHAAENDEKAGNARISSSSLPNAISTSAVQALFKRLARYLKSTSMEQRKAVILALGSTHISAVPILTEVLTKYELEAFISSGDTESTAGTAPGTVTSTSNGGNRKQTKEQKAREAKAISQWHLQWALGRCYRLLILSTQHPMVLDDLSCEALRRLESVTSALVVKIGEVLRKATTETDSAWIDNRRTSSGNCSILATRVPPHLLFMMQQDFCSSVRTLVMLRGRFQHDTNETKRQQQHQCRIALANKRIGRVRRRLSMYKDVLAESEHASIAFDPVQRESWWQLLYGWCRPFNGLANAPLARELAGSFFKCSSKLRDHWLRRSDIATEQFGDTVIPWQWVDQGVFASVEGSTNATQVLTSYQNYCICQSAFSTMAVLLQGPIFASTHPVAETCVWQWLEQCFAVEPATYAHVASLQNLCHIALAELLHSEFHTVVNLCVDRSLFHQPIGEKQTVAKHYFRSLCAVASELRKEIDNEHQIRNHLQVRVCHAILLQIGIENDHDQREAAVRLINDLVLGQGRDVISNLENDGFHLNARRSSHVRSSNLLGAQTVNRMQVSASTYLAGCWPALSYQMSLSILQSILSCEVTQQRKMLIVTLPWLANVGLIDASTTSAPDADGRDPDQVLTLLFTLTTALSVSCGDELEQVWLTISFTTAGFTTMTEEEARLACKETETSNLSRVIRFLFQKRSTCAQLSTAKIIIWWLCRWQHAGHEVLRGLLLLVDARRRQSVISGGLRVPDTPRELDAEERSDTLGLVDKEAIQPMDDVFVFVILISDSSCHLSNIPDYLYQTPGLRESMLMQTVHFSFLALFTLAIDPTMSALRRNSTTTEMQIVSNDIHVNAQDDQQRALYADVGSDCLVLLRNVLGELQSAPELLNPIIDTLEAWFRRCETALINGDQSSVRNDDILVEFESAIVEFASCLPLSEQVQWSHECVKEILLALIPDASLLAQISSRCHNFQVLQCVRFGLLVYRLLGPPFNGDVFLSLMELLHHALGEQTHAPDAVNFVIRDCLGALRSMVTQMSPSKLVLYPQILWVTVALLNHCREFPFHSAVVELLVEILSKPEFATNRLRQDVFLCMKPPQWSTSQSSVLKTLVWNLDRGSATSRSLTFQITAMFVLLPSPVFHVNRNEHLVICTTVLVPLLIAQRMNPRCVVSANPDQATRSQSEMWRPDVTSLSMDLQQAWLALNSTLMGKFFDSLLRLSCSAKNQETTELKTCTKAFASVFITQVLVVLGDAVPYTGLSLCIEIFVKILATPVAPPTPNKTDPIVSITLSLVQECLEAIRFTRCGWRPSSSLITLLSQLIREPAHPQRWEAAVQIMSDLAPVTCVGMPLAATPKAKSRPKIAAGTGKSNRRQSTQDTNSTGSPTTTRGKTPNGQQDGEHGKPRLLVNSLEVRATSPLGARVDL